MAEVFRGVLRSAPPVTTCLLGGSFALMVLTSLDLVSPYQLFYSPNKILLHGEVWRLLTAILYLGDLSISFFWTAYMMMAYCGRLEEESFDARKADFVWIIGTAILLICCFAAITPKILFLSGALVSAMTYLWGRKNPHARMILIFFSVSAPYLPWALLAVSWLLGMSVTDHLIGILVGHILFFLDDIFPVMPIAKGAKPLRAPRWLGSAFAHQ